MLDEAVHAAAAAGVEAAGAWHRADAVDLRWEGEPFDAAICLCEGAFTLLGDDDPIEHDVRILRSIHAALKPGARLVLTALSAVRRLRELVAEDLAVGAFDLETMVEAEPFTWTGPDGEHVFVGRQRMYVPTELRHPLPPGRLRGRARRRRDRRRVRQATPRPERDGDHGDRAQAGHRGGVRVRDALQGPQIRPVTVDDAEGVARVLNEAIVDGRFSLLDTPFSVAAERQYIAAFPARGVFNVAELDGEGIIAVQSLEPFSQYATH